MFHSLACNSCHQVGGSPSGIGPELSAIGTTLAPERIVEEILWPNRQVKEGFSVKRVITDDGKVIQGFVRRTRQTQQSGDLAIQDLPTKQLITVPKDTIDEQLDPGSPMPAGLTTVLDNEQLLDLIQYVTELGKIK